MITYSPDTGSISFPVDYDCQEREVIDGRISNCKFLRAERSLMVDVLQRRDGIVIGNMWSTDADFLNKKLLAWSVVDGSQCTSGSMKL